LKTLEKIMIIMMLAMCSTFLVFLFNTLIYWQIDLITRVSYRLSRGIVMQVGSIMAAASFIMFVILAIIGRKKENDNYTD